MDIKKLVRPELVAMKSYTPIEPVEILEQRVRGKVVKLDGNENPYGCSPRVYQSLADYSHYHIYPDPEQRKLKEALAEYTGITRQHLVCGSGSLSRVTKLLTAHRRLVCIPSAQRFVAA
jgi:histidinol-phosphate aminotransferase